MYEISPPLVLFVCLAFGVAGVVKGISGMGLPTVSMGLLGVVMAPVAAAALLVVPSFVTNLWQLLAGPSTSSLLRRLGGMMIGIVLGTVLASGLLATVDKAWSGFGLGLALISYAGYALMAPSFSIPQAVERWSSPVVGGVAGLVAGATGVFVIPVVPYLQSLRLEKDELVQALGLSFTVSTVALAIGLAANGAFHPGQLGLSTLAIVPAVCGMWLGQKIRHRISPRKFRLCFLAALLLVGLELMSRPFL